MSRNVISTFIQPVEGLLLKVYIKMTVFFLSRDFSARTDSPMFTLTMGFLHVLSCVILD